MAGGEWVLLLIAMLVAYIVSIVSLKFLVSYVKRHDFKVFGYYRIALGVLVIAYFLITGGLLNAA